MYEEKRSIESLVTGRIYTIHQEISTKEAELVCKKMDRLTDLGKESERLNKELLELRKGQEDRESFIRITDLEIARLDNNENTMKTLKELNEMMSSTLQNCFGLTTSEIEQIAPDEQRRLFLKLAEVCR